MLKQHVFFKIIRNERNKIIVFEAGQPKPEGSGRKPGTPNKLSAEIRSQVQNYVLNNMDKIDRWLTVLDNSYHREDKALRAYIKLIELSLPRQTSLASDDETEPPESKDGVVTPS
jgi:hypothetical protein